PARGASRQSVRVDGGRPAHRRLRHVSGSRARTGSVTDIAIVVALVAFSIAISERLITHKLQSAMVRVAIVFAAGLALALAFARTIDPAALGAFWLGVLAMWF